MTPRRKNLLATKAHGFKGAVGVCLPFCASRRIPGQACWIPDVPTASRLNLPSDRLVSVQFRVDSRSERRCPPSDRGRILPGVDFHPMISCPADCTGETGLGLLPQPGSAPCEAWLLSEGVARVDACGAAALRALVEFRARAQQERLFVTPPEDPTARRLLITALGGGLPSKVLGIDGNPLSVDRAARSVILPACRVRSVSDVDALAEHLQERARGYNSRAAALVAIAFAHLAENALQHAPDSSVRAITAVTHDRDTDALRLAVIDLGGSVARHQDAADVLSELAAGSAEREAGGLASLVDLAERRSLNLTLRLTAGTGRLVWDRAGFRTHSSSSIGGFAAWVDVRIPR